MNFLDVILDLPVHQRSARQGTSFGKSSREEKNSNVSSTDGTDFWDEPFLLIRAIREIRGQFLLQKWTATVT
jgi:hypothetical protein